MPRSAKRAALRFAPAVPGRWGDIERLFGPKGAMAGCWCMWWRLSRAEFKKGAGAGNRRAFKKIVERGDVPGILACRAGEPVGWCAVAPKAEYGALGRSRTKRIDDRPAEPKIWSVTCFFIPRRHRGMGLSEALLRAAVAFARRRGARAVEGYPIDCKGKAMDFVSFMGTAPVFVRCGFAEAAPNRPIMRREFGE